MRASRSSSASAQDNLFDITEVDTTTTDESNTLGNSTTTSSDSTDHNDSTTSSGSSRDSSTTSSNVGSTTEGSTTNNSTSTSSSGDNSTTSSDEEEQNGDTFDLGSNFPSNYLSQRKRVKQRQAAQRAQQQGQRQQRNGRGARRKKSRPGSTNTLIMKGVVQDEDDSSVMTGMTDATGMHSVSSQATNQANNMRTPMSIGGGPTSDSSVMTGISCATEKVANTGGGGVGIFNL